MNNIKTLGPSSSKLIHTLYDKNKTIFKTKDVEEITGLKGNSAADFTSELIMQIPMIPPPCSD